MASDSSGTVFNCPLCGKEVGTREVFKCHIHKHMSFKKYACASCPSCFYTTSDRDAHCQANKHIHVYETRANPYAEMVIGQVLRDAEHLLVHDLDTVLSQRALGNMKFESAMESTPLQVKPNAKSSPETKKIVVNDVDPSLTTARRRSREKAEKRKEMNVAIAEAQERLEQNEVDKERGSKRKRSSSQKRTEHIEINEPLEQSQEVSSASDGLSIGTELLGAALRTPDPHYVTCYTCKHNKLVLSDYLSRKDHVSRFHMPRDHGDEDYVELLEAAMKLAFPAMPNSDYDCQLSGCGKRYKSLSSRRAHVARDHVFIYLNCPMPGCTVALYDVYTMGKHLKEEHSINTMKDLPKNIYHHYEREKRMYNVRLDELVRRAFPSYLPRKRDAPCVSVLPLKQLTKMVREQGRQFQEASAPIRRRLDSSSSDSSESSAPQELSVFSQPQERSPLVSRNADNQVGTSMGPSTEGEEILQEPTPTTHEEGVSIDENERSGKKRKSKVFSAEEEEEITEEPQHKDNIQEPSTKEKQNGPREDTAKDSQDHTKSEDSDLSDTERERLRYLRQTIKMDPELMSFPSQDSGRECSVTSDLSNDQGIKTEDEDDDSIEIVPVEKGPPPEEVILSSDDDGQADTDNNQKSDCSDEEEEEDEEEMDISQHVNHRRNSHVLDRPRLPTPEPMLLPDGSVLKTDTEFSSPADYDFYLKESIALIQDHRKKTEEELRLRLRQKNKEKKLAREEAKRRHLKSKIERSKAAKSPPAKKVKKGLLNTPIKGLFKTPTKLLGTSSAPTNRSGYFPKKGKRTPPPSYVSVAKLEVGTPTPTKKASQKKKNKKKSKEKKKDLYWHYDEQEV